ncbi:MAG: TRAM domain-containing protein [Chloroflexi bacterium]|nr:MAG: TRAM domain-containing protein [Chloroflexota bacterium]MBL1197360.1 TRAM domain-containing protein [Chloroflexota bacterium]NOH14657.1 TRAM domain-containing protein [Chloroflexota bacterium]
MSIAFVSRIIGMIVAGVGGVYLGVYLGRFAEGSLELWGAIFGLVGALAGLVLTPILVVRPINGLRARLSQASARTLFAGVIGLIISLIIAGLLAFPLSLLPQPFSQILPIALAIIVCYLGVAVFIARQDDIFSVISNLPRRGSDEAGDPNIERTILMDTSVIIDGRISDIARTGFLAGTLMIPRFVLNELQYIADSGDSLRRQRGRRGLEVLSQLQKDPAIPVNISDIDVEGSTAVDDKLVILARQLKSPILTNDFNLNRVAELQGVNILNINELANAVKAVYLPGEELTIRVIQDGREPGQGVGYLDDGTMVVVQDGNKFIGAEINTVVTKVLQTAAGRMIFSRPEDSI